MSKQMEKSGDDQLLDAQELALAFENTMSVVQGHTEAIPDLLQNTGKILLKLSKRLSTTQMVLLVGSLTLGAVFLAKRAEEMLDDDNSDEKSAADKKQKSLPGNNSNKSSEK